MSGQAEKNLEAYLGFQSIYSQIYSEMPIYHPQKEKGKCHSVVYFCAMGTYMLEMHFLF